MSTWTPEMKIRWDELAISLQDKINNSIKELVVKTVNTPFKGATEITDGESGVVPAPIAGQQNMFLRGDGRWATPEDTIYGLANDITPGIIKLYDKIGTNIDGTMTQRAITEAVNDPSVIYSNASETTLGVTKLYSGEGNNYDGAITQKYVTDAIKSIPIYYDATNEVAGIMKLYDEPGDNTDGAMTQRSTKNMITETINRAIPSYIASDTIYGTMKVFQTTGNNTDGTMSQKAITNILDGSTGLINNIICNDDGTITVGITNMPNKTITIDNIKNAKTAKNVPTSDSGGNIWIDTSDKACPLHIRVDGTEYKIPTA